MADASFGGRAIPGVQVSIGQSKQQIQGIIDSLRGMEQMLDEVRRSAEQTARAVNGITAPKAGSGTQRGAGGGSGSAPATMDRQIARQQQQLAAADRRTQRAAADAEYRRTRTQQRALDQDVNRRFNARLGGAGEGGNANSLLARLVQGAGWAPGMPRQMYLAQMTLGEMGLGLSLPFVAGGMGALGLGVAGLGLNAALVNQNRTGEQMAAQLGTTPAYVTGGGVAGQMAGLAQQFHLSGTQPEDIAGGLVAGGLNRTQATGEAFAQVANLVNVFGMSVKDATDLVSRQYTDLGKTTKDVTGDLQSLAGVALSTGQPASGLAAILAGSPNLQADLGGTAAGQAASIYRSVYGSNAQATSMAEVANAHGSGAFALAGMLGLGDVNQLDALRGTTAGQGQVVDLLNARARGFVGQAQAAGNGPQAAQEIGFEQFNAMLQASGGQAIGWDAWQRALSAAPNAGVLAAQAAQRPFVGPPAPGSAQAGLAATAAGQLAAGAQASQPWNVKDMTVNAASLTIAGLGDAAQSVATVLSGQVGAPQLHQFAAAGGPQGEAANVGLALGGDWAALGAAVAHPLQLAAQVAHAAGVVADVASNPIGSLAGAGLGAAAGGLAGAAGQVLHKLELTLNLRPNNQPTTTKISAPLPNSGQAYHQYTPRGQQ